MSNNVHQTRKSVFDKIRKSPIRPPHITIYGEPGVGKSTLASQFPKPLFIATEDNGLAGIDVVYASSYQDVLEAVQDLANAESLDYKTVVIDSITKLDDLVVEYTIGEHNNDKDSQWKTEAKALTQALGGFGAGRERVGVNHLRIKSCLDRLKNKGIVVIYIAHMEIKRHLHPGQKPYDRISIDVSCKQAFNPYINQVDAVFYCHQDYNVVEVAGKHQEKRTKIDYVGSRVISTSLNPAHVSKNRFDKMPEKIDMKFDQIKKFIPFYNQNKEI